MRKDIHNDENLKQNHFSVSEEYFDNLEGNLRKVVFGENREESGIIKILKPALSLAFAFTFIVGMGYGFIRLTANINPTPDETISISQELDYLRPAQIEFISDELLNDYAIPELENDDIYEFLTQGEYIPYSLYQTIASIEQ